MATHKRRSTEPATQPGMQSGMQASIAPPTDTQVAPSLHGLTPGDSALETAELSAKLGQRVRAARAARAMTMKQLAAEAGISLPYLSRVEKGDGNISIAVLYRLAMALNLPIENLLSDSDRYGSNYLLIVELLKRQSPAQLAEIRTLLNEYASGRKADVVAPRRIALIGLRGAGKSTLGPLIAAQLGVPFMELNREIERDAGISLTEIFWISGQAGYRKLERRCLERIIASHPEVVLATGGGIVAEPATYELLQHSFYNVWLKAKPEEHFERVMAQHDVRIASPQLRQDAMENIVGTLEAREGLYQLAHLAVSTSEKSVEQLTKEIVALVGGQQAM
jgi:XRE family aerobic/anaerobic benzoate catabolism transcriptional regulator